MNDILIHTDTVQENLEITKQVLTLLKKYQLHVNYKKSKFLRKSIEYLGYIISPQGITLSQRHIDAVRNFPQPSKVVEVQRFIGLTNYFRKFIQDYAVKAKPLYSLLRKNVAFNFDDNCKRAFELLKKELTKSPTLRLYNPTAEIELHTDASALAYAAILLQKQNTGGWAPLAFYSQSTNVAEQNYHSFELEMMAVVKAIERFHIYLYGISFTVITDCHALVFALNKAHLNPRIARWTLRLQAYTFKVVHREGRRMAHVDALSRVIVAYVEPIPLERQLELKQLIDPYLKNVARKLELAEDDKFALLDGLIFRKGTDRPRFAVPEAMVTNVIRVYHDDMAHCGAEKTIQGISTNYWFPSLRKRVSEYIV